jgi:hypothetical protein
MIIDLKKYQIFFEDNTSEVVYGLWGAHAMANAREMFPLKAVRSLELGGIPIWSPMSPPTEV